MNQTGLNLIRIVIGSYFIGNALDLVAGVDQRAMLLPFLSFEPADLIGSTLLFFSSVMFMTGIGLRLSSLTLAIFVLSSSVVQNFIYFELVNVSYFWRDLTLACGVLLSYSSLDARGLRRARIGARRPVRRPLRVPTEVAPRRITSTDPKRRPLTVRPDRGPADETDNIFAESGAAAW